MPAYQFEALDAQGVSRKGVIEADTVKSARAMLRTQQLVPMAVDDPSTGGNPRPAGHIEMRQMFVKAIRGDLS